jgi:hypothetical protein
MFIVNATFNKVKETEEFKNSRFSRYKSVEELEEYLKKELETDNIISYIKSIAKIENIINDKPLNEGINISVEDLLQKINLKENKIELLNWINNENSKQEQIKKLLNTDNLEKKLDLLIELADVLKPVSNNPQKIKLKPFINEYFNSNKNFITKYLILAGIGIVALIVILVWHNSKVENNNSKVENNISKVINEQKRINIK